MPDIEIDEIVSVAEAYLSGRICFADWRLWLRRRDEVKGWPRLFRPDHFRTRSPDAALDKHRSAAAKKGTSLSLIRLAPPRAPGRGRAVPVTSDGRTLD
jgi:hypothetical protein